MNHASDSHSSSHGQEELEAKEIEFEEELLETVLAIALLAEANNQEEKKRKRRRSNKESDHSRLKDDFTHHSMSSSSSFEFTGGCHCGSIVYRFTLPSLSVVLLDCNCSICSQTGFLHLIVPHSQFTLLQHGIRSPHINSALRQPNITSVLLVVLRVSISPDLIPALGL
jgi:hypothetical protein